VLSWIDDLKRSGKAELVQSSVEKSSELRPTVMGWDDFKAHVARLQPRRFVFRGQEKPWRLRTGFHRAGRANTDRFMTQDFLALYRHLSARTKHLFNLNDGDQRGAFMNLIQHHGYPTPLLDWTYSPFVAAFFAFRGVNRERRVAANDDDMVRIFIIDYAACLKIFPPTPVVSRTSPHFSLMEFASVENERMVPQQALSGLTNIDDIESYIIHSSYHHKQEVLSCIDMEARERSLVMRELSMMGITAGSMFPGLDGACEELKERHFDM
jgi:hypothetical protein